MGTGVRSCRGAMRFGPRLPKPARSAECAQGHFLARLSGLVVMLPRASAAAAVLTAISYGASQVQSLDFPQVKGPLPHAGNAEPGMFSYK